LTRTVSLVSGPRAVGNRLHAKGHSHAPEKSSLKRAKDSLKFLKRQIKETEAAIGAAVAQDPQVKQRLGRACTVKGVGIVTAASVIAEANGFALFKNKAQLVSYAGYDVVENKSGTSVNSPTNPEYSGPKRETGTSEGRCTSPPWSPPNTSLPSKTFTTGSLTKPKSK